MTRPRKGARRYGITTRSGITLKTYKKSKSHHKLPEIVYVYTVQELEDFAKQRGLEVSERRLNEKKTYED